MIVMSFLSQNWKLERREQSGFVFAKKKSKIAMIKESQVEESENKVQRHNIAGPDQQYSARNARTSTSITQVRSSPETYYNLDDYQREARAMLPTALYEYLASGTDDEQTLALNRTSFKMWYLRPRVMRPVGNISTRTVLFGEPLAMPIFISPAGVHALCDPLEGECASARACGRAGILFGLSQHATRSIEQVAAAAPNTNKWYQSYILKDRDMTLRLVRRAVRAGYKGIFLTVDSVRFGYREADARNGFNALPPPHRLVNYDDDNDDNGGLKERQVQQQSSSSSLSSSSQLLEQTYNGKKASAWDQNSEQMFEQNLSWADVRWLKQEGCPNLPLVVKGIITAQDASLAIDAGVDGIMVSNHGGRQLDGALASIDVLPEICKVVAGRVPVLLDGGIRRGTDVLKALALGATAVGIGKPVFFALSVGGEEAVYKMLQILQTEIEAAMAICGCETVRDIQPELVTRHPSGGPAVVYIRSAL
jgi:isopentenyl diphosphate isomerase/L-lactate dehydrogenase-like FMN-dependent dehydrogenase